MHLSRHEARGEVRYSMNSPLMQLPLPHLDAAGFMGAAIIERLLACTDQLFGFDNLDDDYEPRLKHARLARLQPCTVFSFMHGPREDRAALDAAHPATTPDRVANRPEMPLFLLPAGPSPVSP